MWASSEHNILFNELNGFSNELSRIYYSFYHTPKLKIAWSEKEPLRAYSITQTFSVSERYVYNL
jgi:hypothetical protein